MQKVESIFGGSKKRKSELWEGLQRNETVLRMEDITKTFPGVLANDNVSLKVKSGEVHALLGENGAGKSTLMNILFGLYEKDEGEVFIRDSKVDINSPTEAINLGLGMVHQSFQLIPDLTVTENIIGGSNPPGRFTIDMKKAIDEIKELADQYGLKVDPTELIRDLAVGEKQRVEILKAIYRGAKILILDEPTKVLTPQEVDRLGNFLQELADQNAGIIFITHKLPEVFKFCDRVTVLRDGKVQIKGEDVETIDRDSLVKAMIGKQVIFELERPETKKGKKVLKAENLHAKDNLGIEALKGVSFSVKEGEIFGVAGVSGNGQLELAECITGLRKIIDGKISLYDEDITNLSRKKMIEKGISYIPEDRERWGLLPNFSVKENLMMGLSDAKIATPTLGLADKNWHLDKSKIEKNARDLIEKFNIKTPNLETYVKKLSGGNIQKVLLARELSQNPNLLVISQPTKGLDVGSAEFVRNRILEQKDNNLATILISEDLDEVMSLSDNMGVMYEGKFIDIVNPEEVTKSQVGYMMTEGEKPDQ